MAAQKGNTHGRGRPKGVPNKMTTSVKEAIESAFSQLGGVSNMVKWAMDNETEFYKLYAKLIPVTVKADVNITHDLGDRLERARERLGK